MSNSAGQDEPPPWAGSDPETTEDRTKAHDELVLLRDQFEKASRPDREGHPELSVRRLAAVFEVTSSQAIEALAGTLLDLLFEHPEEYLISDEMTRVYLVMFIDSVALRELWQFVQNLLTAASNERQIPNKKVVTDFLTIWTDNAHSSISLASRTAPTTWESAALHRWSNNLQIASNDFAQTLATGAATEIATKAAHEAVEARDLARQAASETAAATLAGDFKETAKAEGRKASGWTAVTIGSLASVIAAGWYIISHSVSALWIETLFHLALVLPILGLSAFSARLATHHRLLSRWAKTSAVQTRTVGAFALQIPTEQGREELVLYAGRTIFGPPVFADESKTENVSGIPPELFELLKEIVRKQEK